MRSIVRWPRGALWRVARLGALAASLAGCGGGQGGGALHARQVVLEREVAGLQASMAKLERGEPILPDEAVVVSISEGVAKQFIDAQLPVEIGLESYTIRLTHAEARFKGTPGVTLTGSIVAKEHPDLVGELRAIGALDQIAVDPKSGTLRAAVAVDHVDLLQAAGLEKLLGGGTLDELGRRLRQELAGKVPPIEIPVKIEQAIELPAVTDGPVLIHGASMPLAVSVADVLAGDGALWIAINVVPGPLTPIGPGTAAAVK